MLPFSFSPSVEGVISSIGLDGSGYKQYKSGPGLLVSFTHTENVLVWATRQKGQDTSLISCVSLVQTAGGDTRCSNYKQPYSVESSAYVTGLVFTLYLIQIWFSYLQEFNGLIALINCRCNQAVVQRWPPAEPAVVRDQDQPGGSQSLQPQRPVW